MTRHHVILGAGTAGMNAIQTIREIDGGASSITLISSEPPYARMVLPYFIAGQIPERQLFTADADYLAKLGVTAIFDKRVASVDPAASQVVLDDGSKVAYDDLLIATGSSGTRPKVPGADGPGVSNLWTVEDARRLVAAAQPGARVVFVGAGFIGFIVLNALAKRGLKLSVVTSARARVLPRMVDPAAAAIVERWLADHGVQVVKGAGVSEVRETGSARQVVLSNGAELEADLVVLATGVRPNLDFLEGSGIEVEQGIVVDEHLRTSVPSVYAAGDVAQGPDLLGGSRSVHAIEPAAMEHGRVVGANMAGRDVAYPGSLAMNVLDVLGLQVASFGRWSDEQLPAAVVATESRPVYRKLVFDGDILAGAILLGRPDDMALLNDIGMAKGLIQARVSLGTWRDYLLRNPMDIRRAYIATNVASQHLATTLVGRPSSAAGYRDPDVAPEPWPHQAELLGALEAAKTVAT